MSRRRTWTEQLKEIGETKGKLFIQSGQQWNGKFKWEVWNLNKMKAKDKTNPRVGKKKKKSWQKKNNSDPRDGDGSGHF